MGREKSRFFSHWRQRTPDQTSYRKFVLDTGLKYEKFYHHNESVSNGMPGRGMMTTTIREEQMKQGFQFQSSNLLSVASSSTRPSSSRSMRENSPTLDNDFPTTSGTGHKMFYNITDENPVRYHDDWERPSNKIDGAVKNENAVKYENAVKNENAVRYENVVKNENVSKPDEVTAGFFARKEKTRRNYDGEFEEITKIQREVIKRKTGNFNYFPVDNHLNDLTLSLHDDSWKRPTVTKATNISRPSYLDEPRAFKPAVPSKPERLDTKDDVEGTDEEVAFFTGQSSRSTYLNHTKPDPLQREDNFFLADDDSLFADDKEDAYYEANKLAQIRRLESEEKSKYTFANRAFRMPMKKFNMPSTSHYYY